MERVKILTLTLFAATLMFLPKMHSQHVFPPPRPLCVSQFALANYACSMLPFADVPTPVPPPPSPPAPATPSDGGDDDDDDDDGDHDDDDDQGDDDDHDDDDDNHDDDVGHRQGGQGQGQGHGHRHGHGHGHGHGHRHRHRHHRHHAAEPTAAEANCCKWLQQLDNQCVCELLVHLPTFLIRPAHVYTIDVGESCRVSYRCGTPIRIKV